MGAEMMDLMEALEYVQVKIDNNLLVITRETLEDHVVCKFPGCT